MQRGHIYVLPGFAFQPGCEPLSLKGKVIDEMPTTSRPSKAGTIILGAAALILTISVIAYPDVAFDASLNGLRIWFDVVLPALLPFFAMSEIMIGLGVVHFMGVLVEPIMRPVFRIPGEGAFAVVMGLASGYPVGARITARLYQEGMCNSVEGERLVSFANTADPLFMIGAVAVGMFGLRSIGSTITIAHYISVVLVGFLMRWHRPAAASTPPSRRKTRGGNMFSRALSAMHQARANDNRSLGQVFGDAVKDTFNALLFVGGCIMMFSVFTAVLTASGTIDWLSTLLQKSLTLFGLNESLAPAVLKGIFEITIGCQAASEASASLLHRAVIASAVIGWSGFSVHSQVAAMVQGTGIRLMPYIIARAMHGVLAAIVTYIIAILNPSVLSSQAAPTIGYSFIPAEGMTFLTVISSASALAGKIALVIAGLVFLAWILSKIKIVSFIVKD